MGSGVLDNPVLLAGLLLVIGGLALALRHRTTTDGAGAGRVPGLDELVSKGRYEDAAALALEHDRFRDAIDLFLRAQRPARAAQVAIQMGDLRLAAELYEGANDLERAAQCYDRAGLAQRAQQLRPRKPAQTPKPLDRAAEAEQAFRDAWSAATDDVARVEAQRLAATAAEAHLAAGDMRRAAAVFRDARLHDEAVHLYVNVLGLPGEAAPILAELGHHERAAELYELSGAKERAAAVLVEVARKHAHPEQFLDRIERLDVARALTLLDELAAARPIAADTAEVHYRLGALLAARGDDARAKEVFRAIQSRLGAYRDVAARLAAWEPAAQKAEPPRPPSLRDTLAAPPEPDSLPVDVVDAIAREVATAVTQIARRSSLPPPDAGAEVPANEKPTLPGRTVVVNNLTIGRIVVTGLVSAEVPVDLMSDRAVREAREGPSVQKLREFIVAKPCDLSNIEVYYRLGVALLASGEWAEAKVAFDAVEEASPGYRDADRRSIQVAGWLNALRGKDRIASGLAAPQPQPNRYVLRGELGRGGMAVVYRAVDTVLQRDVALKFISAEVEANPALKDLFVREARAVAQLNHPNVVTVYDFGVLDGRSFLAMELVDGETVDAVREAAGRIPVVESLRLIEQCLAALEYAHERRIVHRDVKPSNMMRSRSGLVKLMDFGLARVLSDGPKNSVIAGTPAYMPPEQLRGERVDARADLFAVGASLYEMLTGELPFEGFDRERAPRSIRDRVPAVPDIIARAVSRALTPDPDARFQSAREFLVPVRRALSAVDGALRRTHTPDATPTVAPQPDAVAATMPLAEPVGPKPRPSKTLAYETPPDDTRR